MRYLTILILLISWTSSKGQECDNFHKSQECYVYVPLDRNFKIYNQAKSLQVDANKTVNYKIVLFGGREYIVGVCAGQSYYRKIHLRIIDERSKKVLFDNSTLDYMESFPFTVEKTMPVVMEVRVFDTSEMKKICVGFQILFSDAETKMYTISNK